MRKTSYWEKFLKLAMFITKSYLFIAFEFIFILKHIFCLPKKPQYLFFQMACLQISLVLFLVLIFRIRFPKSISERLLRQLSDELKNIYRSMLCQKRTPGERLFAVFVSSFFSDRVKKLLVLFGLYQSF